MNTDHFVNVKQLHIAQYRIQNLGCWCNEK